MSLDSAESAELVCDGCGACCRTFPILVSIGDARREPRIVREARQLPEWQRSEEWEYPAPATFSVSVPISRGRQSVLSVCDEARSLQAIPRGK